MTEFVETLTEAPRGGSSALGVACDGVTQALDALLGGFSGDGFTDTEFLGAQFDAGVAWVHFPPGAGGLGAPKERQRDIDQRIREAGFPASPGDFVGLHQVAAILTSMGSPEHRDRFLRCVFTGEDHWCQLFSEPGAGSDLANVGTLAVQDGVRLKDKVVIITGAGVGLGRASALLFAEEGARVVVAERDEKRAAETVATIVSRGGQAIASIVDVTDHEQVCRMTAEAVGHYGKLDVLFNNAGIPAPAVPFTEQDPESWRRVFDVNVIGMLNCIQAAIPHFWANGGGVILNCSSGAALVGNPGVPVYTATKGAINAMSRALALDLGPDNIRVNTLCPMGGMSANFMRDPDSPLVDESSLFTDYTTADSRAPLARPNPPRLMDHARAALFLVSDDAGWVSGVALPTDGGAVIRPQMDIEKTQRAYHAATFVSSGTAAQR